MRRRDPNHAVSDRMTSTRWPRPERPDLKALLVVDMQVAARPEAPFGVPNLAEVVKNANRAIAACRAASVPIIFTRHRQLDTFIGLGGSTAGDEFRLRGGVDLVPDLDYRSGEDQCLDKQHWTAFRSTDLDDRLSMLPGSAIAIAGTLTDGCIQATAFDAFYRRLRVVLIEDAIGACSFGSHQSAMLVMANWVYESKVIGADAFARWLQGAPYERWAWTRPNEFPFEPESLRATYTRLVEAAAHVP